jgi:large subunit ribosomal protein L10
MGIFLFALFDSTQNRHDTAMPLRLRLSPAVSLKAVLSLQIKPARRSYATATAAVAAIGQPETLHSPLQPPSLKPAQFRKTQLHRAYTSLLRSTPLIVFFQHNNLQSTEWAAIRRELTQALRKLDAQNPDKPQIADAIKIQVIQSSIFDIALRVVDTHYTKESDVDGSALPHGVSREAYLAASSLKQHPLSHLLSGPLAILTLPSMATQHLQLALSMLSPRSPDYKAPPRRTHPGYYAPEVQNGVAKLMLLGARADNNVMDADKVRWAGGIVGGMDGLHAQLVAVLQGAGVGLQQTLQGASQSLYFTVEGRRLMLEEDGKAETESKE